MPPAGARRPEPATHRGAGRRARDADRSSGRAQSESRLASVAAAESRRIPARGARICSGSTSTSPRILPADTISDGFDNVADAQTISPTLMEGYLRAASQISRLAVGDRNARATSTTWKVPRTASQMRHVDGAPLGTRGGISVVHVFPADGEYQLQDHAAHAGRPAICSAARIAASRSTSRSTASAWRCSTSTRG